MCRIGPPVSGVAEVPYWARASVQESRSQTVDLDYAEVFFSASPTNPSAPTASSRRLDGSGTAVVPCTLTEPVVVVSLRTAPVESCRISFSMVKTLVPGAMSISGCKMAI